MNNERYRLIVQRVVPNPAYVAPPPHDPYYSSYERDKRTPDQLNAEIVDVLSVELTAAQWERLRVDTLKAWEAQS